MLRFCPLVLAFFTLGPVWGGGVGAGVGVGIGVGVGVGVGVGNGVGLGLGIGVGVGVGFEPSAGAICAMKRSRRPPVAPQFDVKATKRPSRLMLALGVS